jgi:hypothetical protein
MWMKRLGKSRRPLSKLLGASSSHGFVPGRAAAWMGCLLHRSPCMTVTFQVGKGFGFALVVQLGPPTFALLLLHSPGPNPGLTAKLTAHWILLNWPWALLPCRQHFGLAVDYGSVIELDSSTDAKFSRHLLVRIPGHAFATNHAMGQFVAQVRKRRIRSSCSWRPLPKQPVLLQVCLIGDCRLRLLEVPHLPTRRLQEPVWLVLLLRQAG